METAYARYTSTRSRTPQATLRNFLRPFRGIRKKHLAGYVAICEFAIDLKRITPAFTSALVRTHDFRT